MTEAEMNRAAAELCGWSNIHPSGAVYGSGMEGYRNEYAARNGLHEHIPDYCHDRNALPELWQTLIKSGAFGEFIPTLFPHGDEWDWFHAVKMTLEVTPLRFVEAALRATGRWKEETQ